MALMFYLSAQSYPPVPPRVWDKLLHGLEYFGLGVLVFRAVAGGLPATVDVRRALLTVAITVGYGASDEVHQLFVPMRSADFRDLVADAFGAAAALIVCWAWHIIWVSSFKSRVPGSTSQR
jgi:VanZ family protein